MSWPSPRSPVSNYGRDVLLFEPVEQAAQFGPKDRRIREAAEERFQCIEHDALGTDCVDRVLQPDKQRLEIVFTRLVDFTSHHTHFVDEDLLARLQRLQIEAHRGDVLDEIVGGFLE